MLSNHTLNLERVMTCASMLAPREYKEIRSANQALHICPLRFHAFYSEIITQNSRGQSLSSLKI
jgi:hypothetical protein